MTFKILLLPGDGIGPEVIHQAELTLVQLNEQFSLSIEMEKGLIGGASLDTKGVPLPEETLVLADQSNAILLGAVGGPDWDNKPTALRPEKGLLSLRKHLNLFANLRPAIVYSQLVDASALKSKYITDLDLLIVRELTGGLYFGEPRGIDTKNGIRVGTNTMQYYEPEIERIARVAFDIAQTRNQKLCSVDKANVLEVSQLWREVVTRVHKEYPSVKLTHMYVDNAAMQLIHNPKQFDVILTENTFGDILSDCSAMLTGSIGMLPSASINDAGFGLYEPVHGSAPDIVGQHIANPIAALLSVGMLLRYSLKHHESANALNLAISHVLEQGLRTKDIALPHENIVNTQIMGDAIRSALKQIQ